MSDTIKTIQQLNLEDDFLFAKVMSDKEVCKKVLEKILGISIREVSIPATQKTINHLYEGKGIRLDVYINDDEGTVYNVEMERGKQKKAILPKRSRYYQGNIDLDIISAGEDLSSSSVPLIRLENAVISTPLRTGAWRVFPSHWGMKPQRFS